jgi:hypothetical protein
LASPAFERMHARARAVRTRAAIRSWEYRQRDLAAGVWLKLRRALAGARAADAFAPEEAERLVAEGYRIEPCGRALAPEKAILVVDSPRVEQIAGRRPIRVGLGPDFFVANAVAPVPFADDAPQGETQVTKVNIQEAKMRPGRPDRGGSGRREGVF